MSTPDLTPEEQKRQEIYRDARFTKQYDNIWKSVGKCVFCDLREKYIFFEEHGIVMTISLYAYIDGHFMIMPRRHIRSPKELTQLEWDTIRKFSYIAKKIIKEVHGVSGMQLVQKDGANAQSTVDQHLHFHCIPFDAPDLCVWNFRKLKYTPLENVELYKKDRKKIIEHALKYDKKYQRSATMRVACDAIIMNKNREVLFQERREGMKLHPDYLTMPGGGVINFSATLESELAREVREETGLDISNAAIKLVNSSITPVTYVRMSRQLKAEYPSHSKFLRNVYLVTGVDLSGPLQPGDDCAAIVWIPLKDIAKQPRISEETKAIFKELQL